MDGPSITSREFAVRVRSEQNSSTKVFLASSFLTLARQDLLDRDKRVIGLKRFSALMHPLNIRDPLLRRILVINTLQNHLCAFIQVASSHFPMPAQLKAQVRTQEFKERPALSLRHGDWMLRACRAGSCAALANEAPHLPRCVQHNTNVRSRARQPISTSS